MTTTCSLLTLLLRLKDFVWSHPREEISKGLTQLWPIPAWPQNFHWPCPRKLPSCSHPCWCCSNSLATLPSQKDLLPTDSASDVFLILHFTQDPKMLDNHCLSLTSTGVQGCYSTSGAEGTLAQSPRYLPKVRTQAPCVRLSAMPHAFSHTFTQSLIKAKHRT